MAVQTDLRPEAAASPGTMHSDAPGQRLPVLLCVYFGIGSLGIAVLLNTVTTFLPALLSTVLGQSAALGGTLLTVSKLFDLLIDIGVGSLSDRTRSRMGRRRPFLLLGAVLGSLSFLPIFMAPPLGHLALILWMGIALMIYSTGYSLFAVPYIAMAGEMTSSYHERTRLFSFRSFFVAVGQLTASAGAAWLITYFGGGRPGYAGMGLVAGLAVAASMLTTVLGTRTAQHFPYVPAPVARVRFEGLKTLFSSRPFVLLMVIKTLQYLSLAIMNTTLLLFFLNALGIGYAGIINLSVVQNIVLGLSMPVWVRLSRRFGKRPGYLAATALLAVVYASWFWAQPGLPMAAVWLRGAITGFAAAGLILLSVSMVPDVMEYDTRRTGRRREGVFASAYAIVEKLGYALGAGVSGLVLSLTGYVPTMRGQIVHQPASAITGLYADVCLIPTVLLVASFVVMLFYPLNEKMLLATERQV